MRTFQIFLFGICMTLGVFNILFYIEENSRISNLGAGIFCFISCFITLQSLRRD